MYCLGSVASQRKHFGDKNNTRKEQSLVTRMQERIVTVSTSFLASLIVYPVKSNYAVAKAFGQLG